MDPQAHEVTLLLERACNGDKDAENRLYEIVMPELRRLAQHLLNGERPNHTLQATELIGMMYYRLSGAKLSLQNRAHFFAIAGRTMRRVLIDYYRARPNVTFVPIDGIPESAFVHKGSDLDIILTINELLEDLRETMPLECHIVDLKWFCGMTDAETAEVLGLQPRTMQLRWQDARIWLYERAQGRQWKLAERLRKGTGASATN